MVFVISTTGLVREVSAETFKEELFIQACKSFDLREEFHEWARKLWGKVYILGKDYGYQIDMLADKTNDHYYSELDNYCKMWANVKFYELTNGGSESRRSVKLNDTEFVVEKEDL